MFVPILRVITCTIHLSAIMSRQLLGFLCTDLLSIISYRNTVISQHLSGLTYFVGCSTYVAASASRVFPRYMNEQRHNKRCLREICEQWVSRSANIVSEYDEDLSLILICSGVSTNFVNGQRRSRSDCACAVWSEPSLSAFAQTTLFHSAHQIY